MYICQLQAARRNATSGDVSLQHKIHRHSPCALPYTDASPLFFRCYAGWKELDQLFW
jgi:hypothetical protein